MNYKRIDALEIKYADSSALKKLKIKTVKESKGGEKRLYIANCKKESEELNALDEFFSKDVEYFFFLKSDLVEYIKNAKDDYLQPKQEYRKDISVFYNDNLQNYITKFEFRYNNRENDLVFNDVLEKLLKI